MAVSASRLRLPRDRVVQELVFIGAPLIAFVGLLAVVTQAAPTSVDRVLVERLQAFAWGSLGFVPQLSSDIGGGLYGFYLVPAVVALVFAATRQWRLLGLLLAVFILHFILISPKVFIETHRPSPAFGVEGAGGLASFPSGHVQWAASFYGLLAYLLWQRLGWLPSRVAVVAGYIGIVALTMLARIDLGRHWPIDTVAGVLAGLIAVRVVFLLHRWSDAGIAQQTTRDLATNSG
jgi:membrane-associated phospholipid phosphatase